MKVAEGSLNTEFSSRLG